MASYFNLTLDTLGPQGVSLVINDGAAKTSNALVTVAISTSDASTTGYQMKIWGISGAELETDASWETYAASKQVTLLPGDGTKTVYVKLRDDVYNESGQASDSIVLDAYVPVVTVNGPDHSKISKVIGKDTSTITFMADREFVEYKVCVVDAQNAAHSAGVVIPTTGGSQNTSGTGTYAASEDITVTIKGADLETASNGDGVKIVKVFVKNDVGSWSA